MVGSGRFVVAAWLIAGLTLASRVLGLVREVVFSYYFSTSELLSAFRIAFQAPNLARRLFGEGALSSAMIPVLTESLASRGEEASRRFVGTVLTVLMVVLGLAVVVVEVGIGVWRAVADDPALRLTGFLMPYMALICTAAVASGVLNVRRHFAVPAAAPTILNIAMVAAMGLGAVVMGLEREAMMDLVCVSVLVAGVIQLILTGVALRWVSFFPIFEGALRRSGTWREPHLRRVLVLMAPMALGLSAVQINTLTDTIIAYLFIIEDGERVGPAVLGYAQFLYQLPLGVFGISIATAIFPVLAAKAAEGDRTGMAEVFERGVRLSLFIALPAAVGLIFVAEPLVATLYQRGAFDASDTRRVAGTLLFYSLGIPAYFTQHIVVRTYYALHNSKTPAKVALWMVALNLAMNLSLVFVLQERGLALATSVCAILQVVWLLVRLRREFPDIRWGRLGSNLSWTALAAGVMGLALAILTGPTALGDLLGANQRLHRAPAVRLLLLVAIGVGVYVLAAWVAHRFSGGGVEELSTVLGRTGHRRRSGDPP